MPTGQQYATNVPQTNLTAPIDETVTTFGVTSLAGWPAPPYTAILQIGESLQEPIDVLTVSGNTITSCTRHVDIAAGLKHPTNATFTHGITGRDLREARAHIDSAGPVDTVGKGVHGLTNTAGNVVVGTKEAQTLINKNISGNDGATDWFNVKAHGAVGDGVTDDTAAINAAITACRAANATGGGVVYFPAGVYGVTPGVSAAAITLNNGTLGYVNIRLVGDSKGGSQIRKLGNGVMISMSGPATDSTGATHCKSCGIEDLHLSGNGFTGQVLQCYYADNLHFQNVRIVNNKDVCIAGVEFWDSRFYNLVCELNGSATANASTPNVWLRCSAAGSGFGFSADSTNEIHFVGCRFETFTTGAMWIQQGTGGVAGCGGIYIVNCKMEAGAINGGPHLLTDSFTQRAYVKHLYGYSGGFAGGYSTAQDIITWSAQDSSLEDIFFATGATQTVANGVTLNSTVANQNAVVRNVTGIYTGLPTGNHVALGTATGGFRIDNCNSNQAAITTMNPMSIFVLPAAGNNALGAFVSGDTFKRWQVSAQGDIFWGPGSGSTDVQLSRTATGILGLSTGSMAVTTAGQGFQVKEGSNAKMGTAVLNGTTEVTVSTTAVKTTSRILLTTNTPGGTVASPYVSSRVASTSFGIKSTGAADTSTVAWLIVDPA